MAFVKCRVPERRRIFKFSSDEMKFAKGKNYVWDIIAASEDLQKWCTKERKKSGGFLKRGSFFFFNKLNGISSYARKALAMVSLCCIKLPVKNDFSRGYF